MKCNYWIWIKLFIWKQYWTGIQFSSKPPPPPPAKSWISLMSQTLTSCYTWKGLVSLARFFLRKTYSYGRFNHIICNCKFCFSSGDCVLCVLCVKSLPLEENWRFEVSSSKAISHSLLACSQTYHYLSVLTTSNWFSLNVEHQAL